MKNCYIFFVYLKNRTEIHNMKCLKYFEYLCFIILIGRCHFEIFYLIFNYICYISLVMLSIRYIISINFRFRAKKIKQKSIDTSLDLHVSNSLNNRCVSLFYRSKSRTKCEIIKIELLLSLFYG